MQSHYHHSRSLPLSEQQQHGGASFEGIGAFGRIACLNSPTPTMMTTSKMSTPTPLPTRKKRVDSRVEISSNIPLVPLVRLVFLVFWRHVPPVVLAVAAAVAVVVVEVPLRSISGIWRGAVLRILMSVSRW